MYRKRQAKPMRASIELTRAGGMRPENRSEPRRAERIGFHVGATAWEKAAAMRASPRRCAGLQRQGVEFVAHLGLERLVDDLVLLHARFSPK